MKKKLLTVSLTALLSVSAFSMERGVYKSIVNEDEILVVHEDQESIKLVFTRQVGQEDSQTVPYPTVCTWIESAKILTENETELTYSSSEVVLIEGEENCDNFIEETEVILEQDGIFSYLNKEEFTKS